MTKLCDNCTYFIQLKSNENGERTSGLCFRNPPTVFHVINIEQENGNEHEVSQFVSRRPFVQGREFCGEWQLKEGN